jgi:hypothetical protein
MRIHPCSRHSIADMTGTLVFSSVSSRKRCAFAEHERHGMVACTLQ